MMSGQVPLSFLGGAAIVASAVEIPKPRLDFLGAGLKDLFIEIEAGLQFRCVEKYVATQDPEALNAITATIIPNSAVEGKS